MSVSTYPSAARSLTPRIGWSKLIKLKIWLGVIGAVLAALFGLRTYYEKRAEKEKKKAVKAHKAALEAGDEAAAAIHASRAANAELRLQLERKRPTIDRVKSNVAEARRRRVGPAAARKPGGVAK